MSTTNWSRLRELAEDRRDGCGQRLAEAAAQRDAARRKLEMLVDYRREYDGRLNDTASGGIDAAKWRSYRAFLTNLERAIDQQTEVLGSLQQRVAAIQDEWREEQRQVDSFRILEQRRRAEETRTAGRRDQKLTDEFASRALAASAGGDD
jgi:flagellar FliJ protein